MYDVRIYADEITAYSTDVTNPDVTLFMIIELVGSTCYYSILNNKPLPIFQTFQSL